MGEHGAQCARIFVLECGRHCEVTKLVGREFRRENLDDWNLSVRYSSVEHVGNVISCESVAVDALYGLAITMFSRTDDCRKIMLWVHRMFRARQGECLGQASIAL